MPLTAPGPLELHHQLEDFVSGEESLDQWLKHRARTNQSSGATRTFVICEESRVTGYYALASGAVTLKQVPGRFRRNVPDPIPVVILARLAVDRSWQGRGIGRALFRDAALRVLQAADIIGMRGIIVHAISEKARQFYTALGFDECPQEPMMLAITLAELRAAFESQ